jgi:cytochrome c biogenesis protein CcmG/thiol:disulfide interchange protein DsbE
MAEIVTSGLFLRRRFVFLAPLALFAVLAGYFVWGLQPDRNPRDLPSVMIDQPVPEFALPPIEGMAGPGLSAADLRTGEVTLVNFFASWCVPCRLEHPLLLQLAREGKVRLFGINYKNQPEEARAWLAQLGDPYGRIGADTTGRIGIDWGVYGLPETFVVDGGGRIRYRQIGPIDAQALEQTIRPLIRELSR